MEKTIVAIEPDDLNMLVEWLHKSFLEYVTPGTGESPGTQFDMHHLVTDCIPSTDVN